MTNKEIFKALSDIECALYYRADGSDNPESIDTQALKKAHDMADELLNYWHVLTGCLNY